MAKLDFGSPAGLACRFLPLKPSRRILTSSSRWSIPLRVLTLPFPGGSVELVSALRSADRHPKGNAIQNLRHIVRTVRGRVLRGFTPAAYCFSSGAASVARGGIRKSQRNQSFKQYATAMRRKDLKGNTSSQSNTPERVRRVTSPCYSPMSRLNRLISLWKPPD